MATTFTGTKLTGRTDQGGGLGDAGSTKCCTFYYNLAAALVIDDVIQSPEFQAGTCILDVTLVVPDLETSGTSLTLNVGYGVDPDYFIAASAVGQAGGVARKSAITALPLVLTTNDTIDIHVLAAPATGATTGRISLEIFYLPPAGG